MCGCLLSSPARGQAPSPSPTDARASISSERAAARYKQSLAANPVEGTALERLWNLAAESGKTAALLDEYAAAAPSGLAPALLHGHLLKKAGRFDDTAAAYRRAASLAPSDPRPLLSLAALEAGRGDNAAAATALESALTLLPSGDARRADALLALGNARIAAGDSERAAAAWEETVRAAPRDLATRGRLADAYESHELPERAIPHQEWIEQHATDPAARAAAGRALGRLHEARGNFEAARAALERARALTAPGNWLRTELGTALIRLHERAGRTAELEANWRAAAEKAPRDLGAWLSLVDLYANTGQLERERAALERALALTPRDRELSLRLARLQADAGDLPRAAATFDALLKNGPANFDLVLERAHLDLRAGRLAEAAARVEAAVHSSRPGDESVTGAALAFFQANRLQDATERALRAETVRRPGDIEPVLALASFLFNEKRPADALTALNALDDAKPTPGQHGVAAARAERLARAADLLRSQNRLDDALRFAAKALAAQPENPALRLALGDLRSLRGEPDAARAAFAAVADAPSVAADVRETAEQKLFAACRASPAPAATTPFASTTSKPALLRRVPPPPKTGTLLGPPVVMRAEPRFHTGVGVVGGPRGGISRAAATDDEPPAVLERAQALEAAAQAEPTAANYLRLARWQSWRRALPEALLAAQAAANAEPTSVPAQEWVVRLATETRDRATAAASLAKLATIDPANAPRYRRQAGHLKLEAGEIDAALALFSELVKDDPASRENLTALALAQQRAGRWLDAAGTWDRAYRLPGKAAATARAEVRGALLGALEHTGQHERAVEVLSVAVAEAGADRAARRDRFRELLAYAEKHGQLDALERAQAVRLEAHPTDAILLAETAALQRARGRRREAYALLERALPGAADPAAALRELVAAAEECDDLDAAIRLQRRLLALDPTAGKESAGWEKLAALEIANLDLDAAARTWSHVVARFPRDPESLGRAQDFFENVLDEPTLARDILRRIVAIDPHDLARQLRLGRAELAEGGEREAARRAFETIIGRTEPEKWTSARTAGGGNAGNESSPALPAFLPITSRGFSTTRVRVAPRDPAAGAFPTAPEEPALTGSDGAVRFLAIGELADSLRSDPKALHSWIERWRARQEASPLDALWAYFYAGEHTLALEVFERQLLSRAPDDARLQRGFLDLVFLANDSPRLAHWLRPESGTALDGEARTRRLGMACEALARYVPTVETDALDSACLDALFPDLGSAAGSGALPRERLWQAANQVLAPAGRLAEAVRLGERVFASSVTGRAACGLQLARWCLSLRQTERARAFLRASFDETGATATDSDDAAFADECLRSYFALLPIEERAPFRERFTRDQLAALSAGRHERSPTQRLFSLLLLDGLAGDWTAGRARLDRLFALGPLSERAFAGSGDPVATRRWAYWQGVGERLANLGFEPLAIHLWKRVLADPARVGLGADAALRASAQREVRIRLAVLELNAAPGEPALAETVARDLFLLETPIDALVALRTRLGAGTGTVPMKADRLPSLAMLPVATRLAEILCAREPESAEHWRALLNAYATADAVGPLERTLRQLLFPPRPERGTATGRASRGPLPRRELATRLANLLEETGDLESAARVLEIVHEESQRDAANDGLPSVGRDSTLLLRLAANLEKQGRFADAARWSREALAARPGDPGIALTLSRLEEALGHSEEATAVLENAAAAATAAESRPAAAPPFGAMMGGGVPGGGGGVQRPTDELIVTLAKHHLAAGGRDRALELARRSLRAGRPVPAQEIAVALAKSSPANGSLARRLFEAVARGSREPHTRFAAQVALVQNAAPDPATEPAAFARTVRRLRRFAEEMRASAPVAWQTARFDLFVRAGQEAALEKMLRAEWADGRGDRVSGMKLAILLTRAGAARSPELAALVQDIGNTPQLDEEATAELLTELDKAGQPVLAAPLAARMCRRFPQHPLFAFTWARLLWRAGSTAEAEALLANLEAGAALNAGVPALAALWRDDLGEPERARAVLLRAVARDPGMSRPGAVLRRALARAELARGDLDAAGGALRDANRSSGGSFTADDFDVALDYLDARGRLPAASQPGIAVELGLPTTMTARLASAAFTRLWESERREEAHALIASRPTLLGEVPGLAARLRTALEKPGADASGAGRRWLIEQLERAMSVAQSGTTALPTSRLAHELAAALDSVASAALASDPESHLPTDNNDGSAALDLLRRACQLEPASLERVRRLGALLVARGERTAAIALANHLIAASDAAPSDKEAARGLIQTWETTTDFKPAGG